MIDGLGTEFMQLASRARWFADTIYRM